MQQDRVARFKEIRLTLTILQAFPRYTSVTMLPGGASNWKHRLQRRLKISQRQPNHAFD